MFPKHEAETSRMRVEKHIICPVFWKLFYALLCEKIIISNRLKLNLIYLWKY
ncbi:unnamed protein product [Acanthoscelides obtectus]|uniref:Uncharacterized protein n=1 Tax=Acanthoscelides obtectus TaxID=200917 RepID=A0A9P0M171_ACAOB|nr:unnamed protein product [Acanthoscelides obtectus]CAK1676070.1 hypothetical protein AOBTE_LOCUS30575 [Acanthoscelides obtectus]